ncbi:motilin receptor [Sorex fumeus]|uniref:motilin receptor n=1 Tax=Sorex fumeus TaxID=62283 RepID=UPI0024ADD550|nr:motilin receptor [Sorex fumeus]
MGSPWNRSAGVEDAAALPCDERRCSAFPLRALVPVTAVCLGLFAVGVGGNALTVLLAWRTRGARSTTDLYLGSLAVADLLVLLGLPLDLYRLWRSRPWVFGSLLCRLSLSLGEGCTYASLLHVTALGAERYLAVCRPLRARVLVTRRRVRALLAALWAVALLSAAPFFFLVGVQRDPRAVPNATSSGPEEAAALFSRECRPSPAREGALRVVLWVTTAYFVLPFLGLSVLYGLIARELWRSRGPPGGPAASGRQRGHRRTIRVLLVVVLTFVVCWLPFHVGRIIYINSTDTRMMYFSQYFNIVALQLFYLSASINPILYSLLSKKYRTAAWKLLRVGRCRHRGLCSGGSSMGDRDRRDTASHTETSSNRKTSTTGTALPATSSRGPGTSEKTGAVTEALPKAQSQHRDRHVPVSLQLTEMCSSDPAADRGMRWMHKHHVPQDPPIFDGNISLENSKPQLLGGLLILLVLEHGSIGQVSTQKTTENSQRQASKTQPQVIPSSTRPAPPRDVTRAPGSAGGLGVIELRRGSRCREEARGGVVKGRDHASQRAAS